ncbi:MAG: Ig-like domain-containing protein, partial [Candidatus Wallbacteria bacterium]|nr:Ig-like domain-containing protein [Candidatus Wallbacteria bacterium]
MPKNLSGKNMRRTLLSIVLIGSFIAVFLAATGCFGTHGTGNGSLASKIITGIANNTFLKASDVTGFCCYIQDKNGKKQNIAYGLPVFLDDSSGRFTAHLLTSADFDDLPRVYVLEYRLNSVDKMLLNVKSRIVDGEIVSFTLPTTIASMSLLNTGAGITGSDLSKATTIHGMVSIIADKLEGSNFNQATINIPAVSQAQATVADRLGFTTSDLDSATAANTATGLADICALHSLTNETLMDEVAKIAVPTTTYNVATITGNATIDTTKDTFTSLTNNNSVVADSELYPTFTISAINDTVVTMGANNNGVVTLTGSPTFRIPQSETVATPVFCATFTALSKNFTTPLRVVFYDAGSSATIELSDLSYVLNDSSFTIPEEAKVSVNYRKNGATVSATYNNSEKGIFTASGNTVNLNMTAPMARTLFSTVNGMIANGSSYNYRLIFDLNLKVNGATYNELAGSLKAADPAQDTSEPMVVNVFPAADTTDVAVNSKISATFSEAMAAST